VVHIKNKKLERGDLIKFKPFAFLFDSFTPTELGGTGKTFNWRFLPHACELKTQIFLSGGLSRKNVKKAIKEVHPHWIDVSSSVEMRPGKKDIKKMKDFIKTAKQARS
jgi:phosphoribosylanthranilate isomerase